MLKRMIALVAVLALFASCQKFAEGRQMFRELLALRDQLAIEFHERVVDVNVSTKGNVTVKFVNSPLSTATKEIKQKRADEVAAFVASRYLHPVSSVQTRFVSQSGAARVEEAFDGKMPARSP
jgi:hypothetical protein